MADHNPRGYLQARASLEYNGLPGKHTGFRSVLDKQNHSVLDNVMKHPAAAIAIARTRAETEPSGMSPRAPDIAHGSALNLIHLGCRLELPTSPDAAVEQKQEAALWDERRRLDTAVPRSRLIGYHIHL